MTDGARHCARFSGTATVSAPRSSRAGTPTSTATGWSTACVHPARRGAGRRTLGALDSFPSDSRLRGTKLAVSMSAMRAMARRRQLEHMDLRNVPFRALPYFDLTLRVPMTAYRALACPTIFDRCRDAGLKFAYLELLEDRSRNAAAPGGQPAGRHRARLRLPASHRHGVARVRHRFAALPGVAARHGRTHPSDGRGGAQRFPDAPALVFSDHGMSRIEEQHAIHRLHRHPEFPKRFLFALDATMVRVWYWRHDAALREEVRDIVANTYRGHWLDGDEIRSFHLRFDFAAVRRRDVSARARHRDLSQLPLVHQAEGDARL